MELRDTARAEVLANFTPIACLAEPVQPVDLWGRSIDPEEGDEDEARRLLMPLNAVCALIERLRLDGPDVSAQPHRSACEDFLARLLGCCRSAPVRRGLLDAIRGVSSRDYEMALASLRTIAA
jgi:hypothetical protein